MMKKWRKSHRQPHRQPRRQSRQQSRRNRRHLLRVAFQRRQTVALLPEAEITGGSGGEAVVAAKGENKEEKATSEPKVIVAGCKEIPEHIYAGDSVNLKVVLKNTNKKEICAEYDRYSRDEGDGISLGNTANTQYYEKLGAGKTLEVPVEIQTDKKRQKQEDIN